jgi:hypothetical protein
MTRPKLVPPAALLFMATHGDQYLSSIDFMEKMSHVVQDLAYADGSEPLRCVSYAAEMSSISTSG